MISFLTGAVRKQAIYNFHCVSSDIGEKRIPNDRGARSERERK
jgi:hypothetical protein